MKAEVSYINRNDKRDKIVIDKEDLMDVDISSESSSFNRYGRTAGSEQKKCSHCGNEVNLNQKNNDSFPQNVKRQTRKKLIHILLIVLLIMVLFGGIYFGYTQLASPHSLEVPQDYSTIQAAIDAAEENTVIIIEPGHYQESIDFKGKNITLRSKGSGQLTIGLLTEDLIEVSEEIKSLFGDQLVYADGQKTDLRILGGKIIGIYFTAAWCGPCRQFSPALVETYNDLQNQNKLFEIVHISSDRDRKEMEQYMNEYNMNWPAVEYGSPVVEKLKDKFELRGIPYLVILDSKGNVISTRGVREVNENRAGAYELWQQ